MKLNKFYNYNDIPEHIRKNTDPKYRFSPKVRSNWEINVPIIKDEPDFYAWKNNHLCCVILIYTKKVYRNFTYVLHEVTKLAEQIDNIKGSSSDR